MFRKRILRSAITGALAVTGYSPVVLAEEPALEEIVVTATRREESSQEVALPVTPISGRS